MSVRLALDPCVLRRRRVLPVFALVALLALPVAARASTITFNFEGTAQVIQTAGGGFGLGTLGETVSFTGSFVLDDTDLNTGAGDPTGTWGIYGCASCTLPVMTLNISGGPTVTWSTVQGTVLAVPANPSLFQVDAPGPPTGYTYGPLYIGMTYAAGTFTDDSLPSMFMFTPALTGNQVRLSLSDGQGQFLGLVGQLTDPTAATVPEPATLTLLGAGLVGIGVRVRRRSKRA